MFPIIESDERSQCCDALILTIDLETKICLQCRKDIVE